MNLKPLSQVLFSLYRGQPGHGQWVVACLQESWPKILGEKLAGVCRPAEFAKSNLQIEILDQDWASALQDVMPDLLERLRTATANEVKSVSFSRQSAPGNRQ